MVSSAAATTSRDPMSLQVLPKLPTSSLTEAGGLLMGSPSLALLTSNVSVPPAPFLAQQLSRLFSCIDNPYGATCYGLSAASMVTWIRDFSNTYHSKTGVYPGKSSHQPCHQSFQRTHPANSPTFP